MSRKALCGLSSAKAASASPAAASLSTAVQRVVNRTHTFQRPAALAAAPARLSRSQAGLLHLDCLGSLLSWVLGASLHGAQPQ